MPFGLEPGRSDLRQVTPLRHEDDEEHRPQRTPEACLLLRLSGDRFVLVLSEPHEQRAADEQLPRADVNGGRCSWASNEPAATAMTLWSGSASEAPGSTGRGRCRVARVSAASAVLSGSSARKITPKTVANKLGEISIGAAAGECVNRQLRSRGTCSMASDRASVQARRAVPMPLSPGVPSPPSWVPFMSTIPAREERQQVRVARCQPASASRSFFTRRNACAGSMRLCGDGSWPDGCAGVRVRDLANRSLGRVIPPAG